MIDRAAIAASRRRDEGVAQAWRAAPAHRALTAAFEGADTIAAQIAVARALLATPDWIEDLLAPLIGALAADPWSTPPLRVTRDPIRIGAVLFETADVTLSATLLSADAIARRPPAATIAVSGRTSVTRYVRAGGARLARWYAGPADADFSAASAAPLRAIDPLPLSDGLVVTLDGRTHGHLVEDARDDVVTLSFGLRGGHAGFVREYARDGGALVRAAAIEEADTRTHMLLTLLRLSGRADAGGCFEAATRDARFHTRWAAMREWLALDVRAATPRLEAMAASDPHGEVRTAAAATLGLVRRRLAA